MPRLNLSPTPAVMIVAASALLVVTGCTPTAQTSGPSPAPTVASSPAAPADPSSPSSTASADSSTSAASPSASSSPSAKPTEPPAATLPRGGREVFPRYRLVGYAGLTGSPTLGRLGTGDLDQRVREIEERAKPYALNREVLPVLEIITTIVHNTPGSDGKYRSRLADEQIAVYLKAARKGKAILLLNIQPGQSTFMAEAKAYERWLKEPDVGLALDPEWAMAKGQRPGRVFGYTTGAVLDDVATYMSEIVEKHNLPEKVLVYHQLAPRIVRNESALKPHRGVAIVKSVDGIGPPGPKLDTYNRVNKTTPDFVHAGFKLFYDEDREPGPLMTPKRVMAIKPRPEYVIYE